MAKKPKPTKRPGRPDRPSGPPPELVTGDLEPVSRAAPKKPKPAPVVTPEPVLSVPAARAFGDPEPAALETVADPGGRPVIITNPDGSTVTSQTPVHRAPGDPVSRT